jgi:DNA-binding winged helix-turn-helix (wHTH) protein
MLNAPTWQHHKPIELAHEPDVRIGDAWLRPAGRILEWNGTSRTLEPRVAQLLVALARQGGSVLGRDDLIDLCWGGRIVGDDAIHRCVAKARRASSGAGFDIQTVPRVGYRLIESGTSPVLPAWRKRGAIVAIALPIAAAIGLLWWTSRDPASDIPSVTVGEFTVNGTDPALAAKAKELGPQIVHVLTTVGVPASASDKRESKAARYRISGTVSRQPAGVLAHIQIADIRSGTTIISQELELDREEIRFLADKVAAAVGDALTRNGAYYALTKHSSGPAETAAFYSVILKIASGDSLGGFASARRLFNERPDSRLAPFALSFATVYALQLEMPVEDRASAVRQGRAAAVLAHRRLPRFGDTYVADCWLNPMTFTECERTYRRALEIDPVSPTARALLTFQLMHAGRLQAAQQLNAAAFAEQPFNPTKVQHRLYLAELQGLQSEEAATWAYAQRYWPRLRFARQRFVGLLASGRWREAEMLVPLVLRIEPQSRDLFNSVFKALREPSASHRQAALRECRKKQTIATPIVCVLGLSMLGYVSDSVATGLQLLPTPFSPDPATRQTILVNNGRDPRALFLFWGDGAKAMRNDPSFIALARRTGLLDYWRTSGGPDFCLREPAPVCRLI